MAIDSSLKLKSLFSASFTRAKDRFPSFLAASVLSWLLIALLVIVGVVFYSLFFGMIPWDSSSNPIRVLSIVVMSIILVLMFFYLISWFCLAITHIIIKPTKTSAIAAFRYTFPLIKGFLWYIASFSLFTLAIFPLGILSLSVVLLLWGFWGSFAGFVYLEKRKKGLANLWESKSIIDHKFWPVLGRLFLMLVVTITTSTFIQNLTEEPGKMSLYFILVFIATVVMEVFIQALQISFTYELYKRLPKKVALKTGENWIWFGLASWVIVVILTVIYFSTLFKNISL